MVWKSVCIAALLSAMAAPAFAQTTSPKTWTADNGNGTFTNPLFYDEFSDPDMIRVGDWFYLTGTTMHTMPGLPILRSKDLVNWEFVSYALDKLDLGPQFRLEDGKSIYGQGIWAPSFRYHNGTFYIFSNVNGQKTQIFTATDPKGPWTRTEMKRSMHDLSVLFDDDGKIYAIWGYQGIKMAQLTDDLTDIVPGSEKEIIPPTAGMGEGVHFYKFGGKYFITSAWFSGRMKMPAARADNIWGPYEVNPAISIDEDFGMIEGHRLSDAWARSDTAPYVINPPNPAPNGRLSLHQGGIVQTPAGEWWGFSMMDYNSVGRLLALSPITWKDGWPYFGLPGNLGRNPRTWVKPKTSEPQPINVPYERSDNFSGEALKPIWQWNHVPVDGKWSLTERRGFLRLKSLPATSFWNAKNSLTQRAIGPMSTPTAILETGGLKDGDVAGLALLNRPYAWIGVEKTSAGLALTHHDQQTGKTARVRITAPRVWLRADCNFLTEKARFSYSTDGATFTPIGDEFTMVFQLKTFQGVRYSLFNYNTMGAEGGYADFDAIDIHEPYPQGLMKPIPYGRTITLKSDQSPAGLSVKGGALMSGQPVSFEVIDMGLGRAALKFGNTYISAADDASVSLKYGKPGTAESFQWIETPTGELALMSLVNHRFLRLDPKTQVITADSPGPQSDGKDGVRFVWSAN
ncbi:glycoside hydrolase family 43 protein [Asticcacaulis endophyticus]|uniref:Beta-xylosidase n=1 Tax=Asticcacaulis endophyticus TaxID=1395890 RepID=A0A918PXW7_9CAUL|nr:glycoside hydrolase 43 family protein [Asticcacaulis endophyticus]GGZ26980.1 beta-xylosidase [Asticcacaulis endophyticus]